MSRTPDSATCWLEFGAAGVATAEILYGDDAIPAQRWKTYFAVHLVRAQAVADEALALPEDGQAARGPWADRPGDPADLGASADLGERASAAQDLYDSAFRQLD